MGLGTVTDLLLRKAHAFRARGDEDWDVIGTDGNLTGFTNFDPSTVGKWLELLNVSRSAQSSGRTSSAERSKSDRERRQCNRRGGAKLKQAAIGFGGYRGPISRVTRWVAQTTDTWADEGAARTRGTFLELRAPACVPRPHTHPRSAPGGKVRQALPRTSARRRPPRQRDGATASPAIRTGSALDANPHSVRARPLNFRSSDVEPIVEH